MSYLDSTIVSAQKMMLDKLSIQKDAVVNSITSIENRIQEIRPKADFYLTLQQRIIADPALMEMWQNFILMIKLTLDNSIEGVTHASAPKPQPPINSFTRFL